MFYKVKIANKVQDGKEGKVRGKEKGKKKRENGKKGLMIFQYYKEHSTWFCSRLIMGKKHNKSTKRDWI